MTEIYIYIFRSYSTLTNLEIADLLVILKQSTYFGSPQHMEVFPPTFRTFQKKGRGPTGVCDTGIRVDLGVHETGRPGEPGNKTLLLSMKYWLIV